jgi:hypothetical protein
MMNPKFENGKNKADLAPITICAFGELSRTCFQTSTLSLLLYFE